MANNLQALLHQVQGLKEVIGNPKILWEEVMIVIQKAQEVEAKIMAELEKKEQNTTSFDVLDEVFNTRERVWDDIGFIEKKALAIKERTFAGAKDAKMCCQHHGCHHTEHRCCHDHCCCHEKEEKKCPAKK